MNPGIERLSSSGGGVDNGLELVGNITVDDSGNTIDNRKPVQFEGQPLARTLASKAKGSITGCNGDILTLYQVADGRRILHTEKMICDEASPDLFEYSVREVDDDELMDNEITGVLSLDEALKMPPNNSGGLIMGDDDEHAVSGPTIIGNGKVWIGSVSADDDGQVSDNRKLVLFEGEQLARTLAPTADGAITGCSGDVLTLYELADGRYILHSEKTLCDAASPELLVYTLTVVTDTELTAAVGIDGVLTLDEALEMS